MMLSLVVLIVGAVVYILLSYPPPPTPPRGPLSPLRGAGAELARIAFFCGLLAYLLQVGGRAVRGL